MDIEKTPTKRKAPTPSTNTKKKVNKLQTTRLDPQGRTKKSRRKKVANKQDRQERIQTIMQSTYKENKLKDESNNTNYKKKRISKTLSYSVNKITIQLRDTTSLIPSHIKLNEDSSCISKILNPTPPPTIILNKVDDFINKFHTSTQQESG